jgi:PPK2 family polyphosphate:nucleotide phosphotransferase
MTDPVPSPFLVPFDGSFRLADAPCAPPDGAPGKKECKELLAEAVLELAALQRIRAASDRRALLLVFQAMDAAGKDGTIRAVTSGVDPAGCQVSSFKQPSPLELDHDFLWRSNLRLPERGRIGIFNRSYYEEVLVVRVHPELLERQQLPAECERKNIWKHRFESIRDMERHLARNGTVILKFFLHVSKDEQRRRFLDRIDTPHKNWKFSAGDVRERQHWDAYMEAFEDALRATSRDHAPWYVIPADSKPFMRLGVARLVVEALKGMRLSFPEPAADERDEMLRLRDLLARGKA